MDNGIDEAFYGDYFILTTGGQRNREFLPLGRLAEAREGADIYIAGFRSPIDQSVVHFGTLSTKTTISFSIENGVISPAIAGPRHKTEAALLDVTMNVGYSGGPVVQVGRKPGDDKVIGILSSTATALPQELATFIGQLNRRPAPLFLTPLTSTYGQLLSPPIITRSATDDDVKALANLVGAGLNSATLGIGACVTIDNATRLLRAK